jgi:hypothetical protein
VDNVATTEAILGPESNSSVSDVSARDGMLRP